ncbi:hypothetical protein, membrane, partial [gut metagenome]
HFKNKDNKTLFALETNMQGISRFLDWLESVDIKLSMTPTMENQSKQSDFYDGLQQWREEYRTPWHEHIQSIRIGLWLVILLFALGVIAPIPLVVFAHVSFKTAMIIGALAPIPFVVFCFVFAPVLYFNEKPKKRNCRMESDACPFAITALLVDWCSLLLASG